MARTNSTLSQTIKLKGQLDISDITAKIQQLRAEASKTTSQGDLLNIDRSIKKLQQLENELKVAMQNGFSTPRSFSDFERKLENFYTLAESLGIAFDDISLSGLKTQLKTTQNQIKTLKQEMQSAFSDIQISSKDDIGKIFTKAVSEGKSLKEAQDEVNAALDKEVQKRERALRLAQEQENSEEAQTKRRENESKMYSMRQGSSGLKIGKDKDDKSSSFTYESTRGTVQVNERTTVKSKTTDETISAQNAISRAYKKAVDEATDAEQALVIFNNVLADFGIKVKNAATAQRALESSLQYRDAARQPGINVQNAQAALTAAQNTRSEAQSRMSGDLVSNQYGQYVELTQQAEQQISSLRNGINSASESIYGMTTASRESSNEILAGTEQDIEKVRALDSQFEQIRSTLMSMFSATSVFYSIKNVINSTLKDVQELDDAFTQIATVTDYSVSDLWDSYDSYAQMANELGQSTKSVVESTAQFYQQGLNTEESLSLATSTMKLATLAGSDFSTATSNMTAA